MEILVTRAIEALLFPPGGSVLLIALGLFLLRRRRYAVALLLVGLMSLVGFSLPVTAKALMRQLEIYPALAAQDVRPVPAQAIVVLAGGRYAEAPEYGGDTVSAYSLERLHYGAHLIGIFTVEFAVPK